MVSVLALDLCTGCAVAQKGNKTKKAKIILNIISHPPFLNATLVIQKPNKHNNLYGIRMIILK